MSKRKKRLEKIRQNPKNVSFEELRKVLEDFGFELVRSKGSHHAFKHELVGDLFVVPYRRPFIKVVYVVEALDLIDQVVESETNNEDD